ncbi:hypothetical protein [Streptosporangium sp. NPDC051022]|uniref:hypothetical protein n=1 Tax=Streptosporangium sp. NPDC051022 TaxID=3155752 RepID=UPI00343095C1
MTLHSETTAPDTSTADTPRLPNWPRADNGGGIGYPRLLQIRGAGGAWHLFIDGEEFPYFYDPNAVVPIARDNMPGVTITLLARHLQVDQTLTPADENPNAWDTSHTPYVTTREETAKWARTVRDRLQEDEYGHTNGAQGLAGLVQVHRSYRGWRLVIDTIPFPYLLAPDAVVPVRRAELPTVEITLLAQRVQLDLAVPFALPHPAAWDTSTNLAPDQRPTP